MSTTTNGAATEAAMTVLKSTGRAAGKVVVDATSAVGPAVTAAGTSATDAGRTWFKASKSLVSLSLDAYEVGVRAYLDFATSVVAAGRANWATELVESNARAISDFTSNYSAAARSMLDR